MRGPVPGGSPADPPLRQRVDAELREFLDRRQGNGDRLGLSAEAFDLIRRFVLADGKRVRPVFCYWGWRGAGGGDQRPIVTAAAALELFHAFALIHDDIMDGSDLRRGSPSVHRQLSELHGRSAWRGDPAAYGRDAALLSGALCAAWSAEMFAGCGLDAAAIQRGTRVYATMRTEVISGQYLDLLSGVRGGSVDRALTVVRLKTARYTVTRPLQIGAALAGAGRGLLVALAEFGDPLGDAFQLRDDLLGVFGDPAVTGKPILDDLREGKPTVLVALARSMADADQAARLGALFGNPGLDAAGAAELREIIAATGARDEVERMIKVRADAARVALSAAPLPADVRAVLADLTGAAVTRHR
ncbi:polyprenyl synthetase family protein [Plantactinospora sp. KBS50]|uniref:polyprenyl synthetase family protein n=1 Tax=Plantactinospora sp. KBS50 TaxID=2024580 RepID=UPI000BAAE784|nr:polyprenyl synthetase family protein [Plantactinospora sp. KBS50]ASW56219.1 polyprenyl synthetase [Plantactinospora sp. KBS50]